MPHAVGNGAVVEALKCIQLLAKLVTDSYKQETPLGAIDGDLSDDFVETLLEESLSNRTDADCSGFALF